MAETRARDLLDLLGIGDKASAVPGVLSGGQRQRLAIARALANEPTLLLADEPTGALDSEGGHEVIELLRRLHDGGQTIVLVTHDSSVAAAAERVVRMRDGRIDDAEPEPGGGGAALSSRFADHSERDRARWRGRHGTARRGRRRPPSAASAAARLATGVLAPVATAAVVVAGLRAQSPAACPRWSRWPSCSPWPGPWWPSSAPGGRRTGQAGPWPLAWRRAGRGDRPDRGPAGQRAAGGRAPPGPGGGDRGRPAGHRGLGAPRAGRYRTAGWAAGPGRAPPASAYAGARWSPGSRWRWPADPFPAVAAAVIWPAVLLATSRRPGSGTPGWAGTTASGCSGSAIGAVLAADVGPDQRRCCTSWSAGRGPVAAVAGLSPVAVPLA